MLELGCKKKIPASTCEKKWKEIAPQQPQAAQTSPIQCHDMKREQSHSSDEGFCWTTEKDCNRKLTWGVHWVYGDLGGAFGGHFGSSGVNQRRFFFIYLGTLVFAGFYFLMFFLCLSFNTFFHFFFFYYYISILELRYISFSLSFSTSKFPRFRKPVSSSFFSYSSLFSFLFLLLSFLLIRGGILFFVYYWPFFSFLLFPF